MAIYTYIKDLKTSLKGLYKFILFFKIDVCLGNYVYILINFAKNFTIQTDFCGTNTNVLRFLFIYNYESL